MIKKRTLTDVRFIDFILEVVQQYGTFDDRLRRKYFVHNSMQVLETAFWLLLEYKVIKNPDKVRLSEIKHFNKNPYDIHRR